MSSESVICEETDTLVLCQGHSPVNDLEVLIQEAGFELHLIGDCLSPRTAEEAVLEGFRLAMVL